MGEMVEWRNRIKMEGDMGGSGGGRVVERINTEENAPTSAVKVGVSTSQPSPFIVAAMCWTQDTVRRRAMGWRLLCDGHVSCFQA